MPFYLALALVFIFGGLAVLLAVVLVELVNAWDRYADRKTGAAYLAAGRGPKDGAR